MDDQGLLLSVVATSRNDDHGANLKRRMQTFVNAFIGQCKRHNLPAELILVEWNPPGDRPRLANALHWPIDPSPCEVRIIEVPEELHRRLQCSQAMPLFQMIAKNVGIRRARGRYILATNIDIILNDELMRFLKEGRLEKGKIYRIDRSDVMTDVPVDAPVEEQLAYCNTHYLRINAMELTHPVTPQGVWQFEENDIASPTSGIKPLKGILYPEWDACGEVFRWAGGRARLEVTAPLGPPRRLMMDISPGPCVRSLPAELEVLDDNNTILARGRIQSRCTVLLTLPLVAGQATPLRIRAVEGGYFRAPKSDCRILDFALHRIAWSEDAPSEVPATPEDAFEIVTPGLAPSGDIVSGSAGIRLGVGWYELQRRSLARFRWADSGAVLLLDRASSEGRSLDLWVTGRIGVGLTTKLQVCDEKGRVLAETALSRRPRQLRVPLPARSRVRRLVFRVLDDGVILRDDAATEAFRLYSCTWSDAPRSERWSAGVRGTLARLYYWGLDAVKRVLGKADAPVRPCNLPRSAPATYNPPLVHTNACGDFTLLAREDWFDLGAYAELEMYSLHIDTLLLYAAHYAGLEEVVLPSAMRAFHIEHSAGSGWTPEGESLLFERLRSKGIAMLTLQELYAMAERMATTGNPRLFKTDGWGFAGHDLPETRIGKTRPTLAA